MPESSAQMQILTKPLRSPGHQDRQRGRRGWEGRRVGEGGKRSRWLVATGWGTFRRFKPYKSRKSLSLVLPRRLTVSGNQLLNKQPRGPGCWRREPRAAGARRRRAGRARPRPRRGRERGAVPAGSLDPGCHRGAGGSSGRLPAQRGSPASTCPESRAARSGDAGGGARPLLEPPHSKGFPRARGARDRPARPQARTKPRGGAAARGARPPARQARRPSSAGQRAPPGGPSRRPRRQVLRGPAARVSRPRRCRRWGGSLRRFPRPVPVPVPVPVPAPHLRRPGPRTTAGPAAAGASCSRLPGAAREAREARQPRQPRRPFHFPAARGSAAGGSAPPPPAHPLRRPPASSWGPPGPARSQVPKSPGDAGRGRPHAEWCCPPTGCWGPQAIARSEFWAVLCPCTCRRAHRHLLACSLLANGELPKGPLSSR